MGRRSCGRGWACGVLAMRAVLLAVLIVIAGLGAAQAETRIALVAGNAAYGQSALRNARHDAELMSATLKSVGFEVIEAFDANQTQMRAAITEFSRRIKGQDTVALFYYAGHGVQSDGENYLIPIGAGIAGMTEVAINAIALGDVMKILASARTRLNIVILDACRDNPFAGAERGIAKGGLAPEVAPSGTIIGYATAPGQTARDGAGANSPYTAALAFNIPRPGTTLEEVFRDTRRAVLAATGGAQVPWEHSSIVGAFYFKEKPLQAESSAARAGPEPAADARLAEVEAWERIKDAREPAAFKAHIARYPGGLFAELAALKLARLEAKAAELPWSWEVTGSITREATAETAAELFERAVMLESKAQSGSDGAREAAALYAEAAEKGLPQAMYETARAFDRGRGVARDLTQAARWYAQAAERGHPASMAALGTMYEFGEGVALNMAEALRLYRLAADKGDAAGMTSLAYLLAEGKGAARNAGEARRLYERAAAKGHLRAQFNLALMQLSGDGGRRDSASAAALLRSAAAKGHAGANEELAQLYDQGRAVARDPRSAALHILAAIEAARRDGRSLDIFRRHWSHATRRELQKLLADKGLYSGLKHGLLDAATRRALQQLAQR